MCCWVSWRMLDDLYLCTVVHTYIRVQGGNYCQGRTEFRVCHHHVPDLVQREREATCWECSSQGGTRWQIISKLEPLLWLWTNNITQFCRNYFLRPNKLPFILMSISRISWNLSLNLGKCRRFRPSSTNWRRKLTRWSDWRPVTTRW